MEQLFSALDLPTDGRIAVHDVRLLDWGRRITLACIYRAADGTETPFRLSFDDCRELKWRVYAAFDAGDDTELVDFRPGRGQHRSPAHLLTGRFGLSLVYGTADIQPTSD